MIEKYITHPYVSPLFGDFTGLPPMLIQAGDAEVLRDEITLLSHKAAMSGVKVEHEVFEVSAFSFPFPTDETDKSPITGLRSRLPSVPLP
jgi:acetyl esterase/lipase